jgi:hypothetical protein
MRNKKDQHIVGTPEKPRGQQTGFAGHPDQNREEKEHTPAVRGRRKTENKMSGDESEQHISSDPTTPSTNSPSIPAMNVKSKGGAGGEAVFKRRLARKREGH